MLGVLLLNLGTPDSPTTPAVRRYLREFLSDPRVIDVPAIQRWFLVNVVIAPFRAPRSAAAYRVVWGPDGSPLLANSRALAAALQDRMQGAKVALGMRYGSPSLAGALAQLEGCSRIVVVPLYPQYASSSTGTALEQLYDLAGRGLVVPPLAVVPPFYDHPAFIEAFAEVARPAFDPDAHLVLSFHGLPQRQLPCSPCADAEECPAPAGPRAQCYRAQCYATARALAAALGAREWSVAFQSRLGKNPWIKPYFDHHLDDLAAKGARRVAVICPSFVADCLETLEEVGVRAREQFAASGGDLTLLPCLNSAPAWVAGVERLVREAIGQAPAPESAAVSR